MQSQNTSKQKRRDVYILHLYLYDLFGKDKKNWHVKCFAMSSLSSINCNDVVNKEARSSNNEDLGEVQEVDENYIFVQRGIISKDKFYIPIDMVETFDGKVLHFSISEEYATAMFLKLD